MGGSFRPIAASRERPLQLFTLKINIKKAKDNFANPKRKRRHVYFCTQTRGINHPFDYRHDVLSCKIIVVLIRQIWASEYFQNNVAKLLARLLSH